MSDTLKYLRWGRGDDGNWHITPHISMNGTGYVFYECPSKYGSMVISESFTLPPDGATLCVHCRGAFTAKLVEET